MSDNSDKIAALQARLENLVKYHAEFQREVNQIRQELHLLRVAERNPPQITLGRPPIREPQPSSPPFEAAPSRPPTTAQESRAKRDYVPNFTYCKSGGFDPGYKTPEETRESRTQFEKFIGENLISKLGIAILVIGVAIGAKYAIDNNLISPLTRIILGYVMGFGLIGFAIKLKPKYLDFSAVLMSGGMAVMYFITYFAYTEY